jgi:alpha-tubulin suppressor-like RCC1 family protein
MNRGLCCAATIALLVVSWASVRSESGNTGLADTRRHVGAGGIAAGRAHTVIARPDGQVFAWGAGQRGQLGIGGLADRLSPTEVPGLVGIVSVSAGAAHSVALGSSGEVYAWGANTFGRIGDGTRKRRDRPVRVGGLGTVKMIAAGRAHTLALTTDGRVFAWGLNANGQVGNGRKAAAPTPVQVTGLSDVVAIAAGDAHSLAVTRDGRLFAWGRNESSALGDGTAKDRATPVLVGLRDVVSVAGGGAHSLALVRSGAVYSWGRGANGELGTGSTKVASTPKLIAGLSASAIAAGRHFSGAITTDGHAVTWGANGSGQLGDGTNVRRLRPVPVLGGSGVSTLALGDLHGAAATSSGDIRTWGEGADGRLGSGNVLDNSAPVEIISDVPDWGAEPGSDPEPEPEPIDSVPPVIRAIVSPPLEGAWMTSPVTVSFECEDAVAIASCSGPMVVSQDGVTQVTGTAVDTAGNRSIVSVTVSLDVLPPSITIGSPPGTIEAEEIIIGGSIADAASGLVEAHCNGQPLAIVNGAYECAAALRPGRNEIIVSARDAVGHESTATVAVSRIGAPTSLFLTPATRTVGLNEVSRLTLRDEFGMVVERASWSAEDDTVVSLTDDEPPVITAVGLGATLVAAEKDGLRAEALIRVLPSMAPGDERWTLPSTPLLTPEPPLFANRVSPDGAYLFAIDYEDWDRKLVRAVSSEGEVLWQQHVPGIPLLADAFGGMVVGVHDEIGDLRALVRTGGGTISSWRYDSPGILDRPAQAHDGTLYTIESVSNGRTADGHEMIDRYAIVIDGTTGRRVARTKLASDLNQFISESDGTFIPSVPPVYCRSYRHETPPEVVGPIAGADGLGYIAVRRHKIVKDAVCTEPFDSRTHRTIESGIDLIVLSRTAAPRTVPIVSIACDAAPSTTQLCDRRPRAFQIMPDGVGGTLVTWERATQVSGRFVIVENAMTLVDGDTVVARNVPSNFSIEMIGQDGVAITYGDGWKAMDVKTGETNWSGSLAGLTPLAARPDGGVAAIDWSTNELATVNASGAIESRHAFGLDWRSFFSGSDWIGIKGESIAAVAGNFSDATRFSLFDTKTGQLSERRPGVGIWLKTHDVLVTSIQHASIRVTPADQEWLINNRAKFETCAGTQQCVPIERDGFKNYFFTIGAGSGSDDTNPLCNGILTKGYNRPNDVRKQERQPLTQLLVDPRFEPILINSLINRTDAFANVLSYHCLPEEYPGQYNSNSFAHGLLHAASVAHDEAPPTRLSIPGWQTPVPQPAFFKK